MSETRFPANEALAKIIYRLMTNPRGWRVDELMDELGIADRTYRKYRKLLQDHFDYALDSEGRSRVVEIKDGDARYLRIREFGEDEQKQFVPWIISLYLGRSMLRFCKETEIFDYMEDFYKEVFRSSKDREFLGYIFRDIDRMLYSVPFAPKDYSKKSGVVKTIMQSIFSRKRIQMTYLSTDGGEERTHDLEPYTLFLYREGLYLVGKVSGKRKPSTFSVDRVKKVEVLSERFEYPRDYSPEKYMDGCFGIYRDDKGQKHKVELIFANNPGLKRNLRERRWHKTQKFEDLPDGRLKMTFTVNSMVEVWPWIRSFGEEVEIVTPNWITDLNR